MAISVKGISTFSDLLEKGLQLLNFLQSVRGLCTLCRLAQINLAS